METSHRIKAPISDIHCSNNFDHLFVQDPYSGNTSPLNINDLEIIILGNDVRYNGQGFIAASLIIDLSQDIPGTLYKLEGDFVIAVWNRENHHLILARERLGRRNLYYFIHENILRFSDHLNELTAHLLSFHRLSSKSLDLYFSFGFVPAPYTIFQDIYKVPAGHYLSIVDNTILIQSYMTNTIIQRHEDAALSAKELYLLLNQTIAEEAQKTKQIQILFSGGLDSALIAYLAKKQCPDAVSTLCVEYPGSHDNHRATLVANTLGTNHKGLSFQFPSWTSLCQMIKAGDEPKADSLLLTMTFALSNLIGENRRCLSGLGADDIFAGLYEHESLYHCHQKSDSNEFPPLPGDQKSAYILQRMLSELQSHPDPICGWQRMISKLPFEVRQELLAFSDAREETSPTVRFLRTWFATAPDFFIRALQFASQVRLPDLTMQITESACQSCDITLTSPYLQREVCEFAKSLPFEHLFTDEGGKYPIRILVKSFLTEKILLLPKAGFSVPLTAIIEYYYGEICRVVEKNQNETIELNKVQTWLREYPEASTERKRGLAKTIWPVIVWIIWWHENKGEHVSY